MIWRASLGSRPGKGASARQFSGPPAVLATRTGPREPSSGVLFVQTPPAARPGSADLHSYVFR